MVKKVLVVILMILPVFLLSGCWGWLVRDINAGSSPMPENVRQEGHFLLWDHTPLIQPASIGSAARVQTYSIYLRRAWMDNYIFLSYSGGNSRGNHSFVLHADFGLQQGDSLRVRANPFLFNGPFVRRHYSGSGLSDSAAVYAVSPLEQIDKPDIFIDF